MPSKQTKALWKAFQTIGSARYRDKVYELNMSRKKPGYIHDSDWPTWVEYWKSTAAMDLAKKNKDNRRKVPSDGDGMSRHFLGTQSVATRAVRQVSVLCIQLL